MAKATEVSFDNGSQVEMQWCFDPGKSGKLYAPGDPNTKHKSEYTAEIPKAARKCGFYVTGFTGRIYASLSPRSPELISLYTAPNRDWYRGWPTTQGNDRVYWGNESSSAVEPYVYVYEDDCAGVPLQPGNNIVQGVPVVRTGDKFKYGLILSGFTGRVLFTFDLMMVTADNQKL
jgi:hypothetical protein